MYTVTAITALTDTHISVLLSDDVAYDVDREAFEEYVAPNGVYEYNVGVFGGPMESAHMPLSQYWDDFAVNNTPHIADLNDYISHSKSEQLEIDVVRAWNDCKEQIHTIAREFISGEYADAHMHTDMAALKVKIGIHGLAQFNLGQYKNQ